MVARGSSLWGRGNGTAVCWKPRRDGIHAPCLDMRIRVFSGARTHPLFGKRDIHKVEGFLKPTMGPL